MHKLHKTGHYRQQVGAAILPPENLNVAIFVIARAAKLPPLQVDRLFEDSLYKATLAELRCPKP